MCDFDDRTKTGDKSPNDTSDATKPQEADCPQLTAVTSCQLDEIVSLQNFRSRIVGSNEASYIRGIIDGGSQRTFIKEDRARRLTLKIIRDTCLSVNMSVQTPLLR